ncbi:MAG: 4-(cytidine 5'-diphospho)-2-C-methyl-D-erythritol kinase [bacterium]|nr:4-(cytidine 5'-diphospho)-2-C-methyl-D-erythritol kinase [bacterium]
MKVTRTEQGHRNGENSDHQFHINAPAKVNLSLHIKGRRTDGYHELTGLVAFADVADKLHFRQEGHPEVTGSGQGWSLEITGPFAADLDDACDSSQHNLVVQAARLFQKQFEGCCGGEILLEKKLPIAAGIGGGSSDAAATLKALQEFSSYVDEYDLREMAEGLGADVAMCLSPTAKNISGTGGIFEPATEFQPLPCVLVNPGVRVSTPMVFKELAAAPLPSELSDEIDIGKFFMEGLPSQEDCDVFRRMKDIEPLTIIGWLRTQRNDLQEPAIRLAPVIADVLEVIGKDGSCRVARMSGSGATCFGLYDSKDRAEQAALKIRADHPDWWVAATMLR